MKIKLISTAVFAALYGMGTLHAAAPNLAETKHRLVKPDLDIQAIQSQSQALTEQSQSLLQNDGLNVEIRSQQNKFAAEEDLQGEHVYLVRMRGKPLVAQDFGQDSAVRSHSSSLFKAGKAKSSKVESARSAILAKQRQVLNEMAIVVGGKQPRRQFTNGFNGFSITVTQEQAKMLAEHPDVAFVQRSKVYEMHTDAGPDLIEADKLWSGGASEGVAHRGEGLIVGVIDSGINTDHPSFAAVSGDGYRHTNPFGSGVYVGDCEIAEYADLCNDKLIGVRSYDILTDAFTSGELGAIADPVGEDYHGHGSHVAATVAGNVLYDLPLSVPELSPESDGVIISENIFPEISGVAPRANIISYQVCQPTSDVVRGCPGEALVAAIEDAIADGVDVINFSIGGQDSHPWSDAVEMAFLGAREAGILVAAAAGNSGQAGGYQEYFGAIDHASPWLLNVAASTHGREVAIETVAEGFGFVNDAEAGSRLPEYTQVFGAAINEEGVTGVLVHAENYLNVNGVSDRYCGAAYPPNTFDYYPDGTLITDNTGAAVDVIVACARDNLDNPDGVPRTLKAQNIKDGGADGFVLHNYATDDPLAYTATYPLPTIHVTRSDWDGSVENGFYGLADWLRNNGRGHMMTIQPTVIERRYTSENEDWLAPFSSRGPSPSTPEALIPAVAAPGVDIYSAWSDEHPFASVPASGDYSFNSGTSMASPHAAGALALLKEAHPDWTASEIQSALVMTADNVVKYRRLNRDEGEVKLAETYRAGTGRINVANAVNAGLVMDESAENFAAANPKNGGDVHRLNLPQLVDFSCKPTCVWMRTVRATKDGSWTLSADATKNWSFDANSQFEQNGVNIEIQPTQFSLKAGETQNIIVKASIMDTQDIFSNSEVELHSALHLVNDDGTSSDAHWPIVFKFDNNDMPSKLEATTHRDQGTQTFKDITLPEGHAVGRAFAPVKADVFEITLPKDDDRVYPWTQNPREGDTIEQRLDEATHIEWVYVPDGSKRLIAETIELVSSPFENKNFDVGNFNVYVGKDYNGNQVADINEEILCVSNHIRYFNFCNINEPEEGNYWVVFYNAGGTGIEEQGVEETYSVAVEVVSGDTADNLIVNVPYSDGRSATDIELAWNIPGMNEGDVYYSVIDFGTSEINSGNIGKVPLKLVRGKDDVSLEVTQTAAKKGDIIPYNFAVLPNHTGRDRDFSIEAKIPSGLRVLSVDTNNSSIASAIEQTDGVLTISGVQPDTSDTPPHYNISTNLSDAQCRTPNFGNSNVGGYVNLAEFNIYPSFGGFAPVEIGDNGRVERGKDGMILHRSGIVIPIVNLFNGQYDGFHLYNNMDQLNVRKQNAIELRGTGVISLWEGSPFFSFNHFNFPYNSFPYESVAPLWRGMGLYNGQFTQSMMSVPLNTSPLTPAGISLASTGTGWAIIEYDDARSYDSAGREPTGEYIWTEREDRFDFQWIFNAETRFGENEYEMFMAYDNIDFAGEDGRGSIGLQGFRGLAYERGPFGGYLGESFAYNDLDEKLHDDLVVCYDYVGPESSQFTVTVLTEVTAAAVGAELDFSAVSRLDGMQDIEMSHTLSSPSNISVGAISDQTIDENTSLEDLVIYYSDEETSANQISIVGDNISAEVHGHETGSAVTITPDADFHGEVVVTVVVSDIENPTDADSTTFTLTVVSDGEEPETGTTEPPAPEPEPQPSSSGSFGWWMLGLFGLAMFRRRK